MHEGGISMTRDEQLDLYWEEFQCGVKNTCPNLMLNNKVPPAQTDEFLAQQYKVYKEMKDELSR
jgi:hypothetical protein